MPHCYSGSVAYSVNAGMGTHEDERTVLYKTKSLDGIKPNINHKTIPNPNTNPNPKITQILTLFSCFMFFSSTVPQGRSWHVKFG